MRGLKLPGQYLRPVPYCRIFYRCVDWNYMEYDTLSHYKVASFTDAWIETQELERMRPRQRVASFTDAWIETWHPALCNAWLTSHLLQMRGLKLVNHIKLLKLLRRIFYRCVDWNEIKEALNGRNIKSHLLQMRGLKLGCHNSIIIKFLSHLLQMRGLKRQSSEMPARNISRIFYRCVDWNQLLPPEILPFVVASFTDAWIETVVGVDKVYNNVSHLLQMRGLKLQLQNINSDMMSRIFYRCVDWNL